MLIFIKPVYAESVPEINEGIWEITTTVEMPGMPVAIPPTKHTQCITKEELIPKTSAEKQDCTMMDHKISANTVSWTMQCNSSAGTFRSSGKVTYSKDSFTGSFITEIPRAKMKMESKMTGQRKGPCK
jgi:hypothetical protein